LLTKNNIGYDNIISLINMPLRNYSKVIRCPNCNKSTIVKKVNGKFNIYFCTRCCNGFTQPVPKRIQSYYPDYYWRNSTPLEDVKNIIFNVLQKRRISCINNNLSDGNVLDVGSGEGRYFSSLSKKYSLVSLEPPGSNVKNKLVIKKDFLKWTPKNKFDIVCFWESLEHTPYPQKYLEKAFRIMNNKGKIFIEIPQYDCIESKLFGKYWFHLDLPRHLSHFTQNGIVILLKRTGFTDIKIKKTYSFDYAPWGLMASVLNSANINITDYFKKTGNLPLFFLIAPIVLFCSLFEVMLSLLNKSPIILVSARKG
jgi:2-polyprenyl-3-methyl-5-hydroxy-6-metoxy-1,4-benzoquinol methylase